MPDAPVRVAMVGTFDVANFGDLLFPLIARHELERRLGAVEVVPYSYHPMAGSAWPFEVRALGALPRELSGYDLLLVGGGHLIRGDAEITADGYHPGDPGVHHPLGMWLVPTLLAGAAGLPVVWNAVGALPTIPDWAAPLVAAAAESVAYLALRDDESAAMLADIAPAATARVVPDTALGVGALLGAGDGGRRVREAAGLNGQPYVVVQPSLGMRHVRDAVVAAVDAARRQNLAILEVPIGPVLGDTPGLLELPGATGRVEPWPAPLPLVEVLGGARAVIADSLHAGLVTVATGVPLLRPKAERGTKYAVLEGFPGVQTLGAVDPDDVLAQPAGLVPPPEVLAQVDAHWDSVVETLRTPRAPAVPALRLLGELPRMLEDAQRRDDRHAVERERAAEFEAGYEAFRARTAELRRERDAAVAQSGELDHLRERAHTLGLIEAGGWWRLRSRLLPLLRVAGALRRLALRART